MRVLLVRSIPVVLAALAVLLITYWLGARPTLALKERLESVGRRLPQVPDVQFPGKFAESGAQAEGAAAMYGMLGKLPDRGMVTEALLDFMDGLDTMGSDDGSDGSDE